MNDGTKIQDSGIDRRIAELSPEKRALLRKRFALANEEPVGPPVHRASVGAQDLERSAAPASIVPVPRAQDLPLSFAQQRLWFLDRILPDKAAYNMHSARRLQGPLSIVALQCSLDALVARHEILRTHFALRDGEPVQLIDLPQSVALPLTDLSALAQQRRETRLREIADAHALQPFDLESGPLLRAQLLRLGSEEHVLLLNMHHVVSDGWSVGLFERELSVAYAAFVKGREPQLPALPIQYADYAAWQREWLKGEVLQAQLGYWEQQLADLPTLELPTDRPRPLVQSYHGARMVCDLPARLCDALRALGRGEEATLFMTLLAAFQVLLCRYSGQEDIVVGTPIAGRGRTELEGLIGFFANTLVLRSDLSGNPSFRELLSRVRETALGAYTHQHLPFEKLVEELAPARDMSRNPLFQVMFVLQNAPDTALRFEDVEISRLPITGHTAKFDLTVSLRESAQGLRVSWEYATDLFDAATIERMSGHFAQLLEAIVADPEQRIGHLPLLSAAERQQLLVEWNDTAADYPRDRCIQQLFEEQVARSPDAVAIVCEDEQITYAELNARANQLAHYLVKRGVGPEVLVGICLERSIELIVGLIAILKAGGAYVPLDPAYPQERLAFMLEDTQAPVLITQQHLIDLLPAYETHLLCIDRDWNRAIATQPDSNPACRTAAESLAYVIYTSGSTGKPKGVAVPHRGVLRLLLNNDYVQFDEQQTFMLLSPISFDASTFELWGALLHGARCAIFRECVPAIAALGRALDRYRVGTLWLTASLFNLIVDEAPQILARVRQLLTGGEALSPSHVRAAIKHLPDVQLINGYGPTESTTFACCYRIPKVIDETWASIPIGRPIRNTRVYILGRYAELVPIGVQGELHIGGDGLAQGYLHRPELTAEKFVPDPFSNVTGARMYRTGDLARYLPDGSIELRGRIDDQLKIRGFRIEPGEIETVLGEHPTLRQAVVIAREDTPGDKHLVAYVVPIDSSLIDVERLRAHLRARLPEYMRPSAYVLLERMPLTANGKIARNALPPPQEDRTAADTTFAPARDALEEMVSEVWREVLKLERVGVDDNFFELGGHSLLAAQVIARLAKLLNVELPLRGFFESPTLSAQAAEAAKRLGGGEARDVSPIARVSRDGTVPLSFAQQRLWFIDRILLDKAVYNMPSAWRLRGRLDVAALQRSLDALVARHEVLRTAFAMIDAGPVQIITAPHVVVLPFTDLSTLAPEAREVRAREITDAEARQPFDLGTGPLLRAQLLRLAAEEHVLLVNVHHIVSDGWSAGVLEHELSAAYAAFVDGQEPPLPALPIQYADYALWQREWLQGEVLQAQLDYWKQKLADLPALELPTDRPRPSVQSHRGARVAFDLPAHRCEALKALGRREGSTLFMTLLAAFQVLLYRYSGQEDIAVGTPIAGRKRTEFEGLIGFFANTLVLRSDLSGDPSFRELLARVRETAIGAYTHQDLPFEKLVEELAPARDLSRDPLFQVLFVLQNAPAAGLVLEGVDIARRPFNGHTAKFDLTVSLRESAQGLRASWEYASDLFDAATIERMARHFERLLEAIAADPEQRIGQLPILSEAERHQLLVQWNDTATDYPQDRSIQQLFEAQAARAPEATALICEDEELTYAELNARANQLAHHLVKLGVGPEVLVGICVERSLELIIGLVAILKAGGAYVPLDPSYPKERLAFMLEDTQAPVLITQQALLAQLPSAYAGTVLCMNRDRRLFNAQPHTNPPCRTSALSLAYVIYTSGSTGRPKGVAVPHRGVLRLLLNNDYVRFDEQQTFMLLSPISFDASTFELWGALLHGARCAVFSESVPTIAALGRALDRYRVGTLWLTASLFNLIVDEAPQILGQVRQLLTGGEALSAAHVRAALKRVPDVQLINGYGPTESTTFTCCYRIPEVIDETWASIPIGRPICNTRVYILDRHNEPVPIGVPGELHIGGDGLARGYLNHPELTAEKFLPDPFSNVPGARMYRTGDLARYRPDGAIEFLARIDDQVKIRGFRIEPGEIEVALAEHPAVRQVVVLARADSAGEKRLVAYVVPTDAGSIGVERLREHVRQRLPEYMRPAAYVLLAHLPLTANGKVDRDALPATTQRDTETVQHQSSPRDEVERTLCRIWGEILAITQVGIDDNFFELGGHSLLAARLFTRLDRAFGRPLPLGTLFNAPTVRELARFYRDGFEPAVDSTLVPITSGGSLQPVFAVAPGDGNILTYWAFAHNLGPEQPLFGLQYRGMDSTREPLESAEQIATQFLSEVRRVQPRGPYQLLGACFGAIVAFEMGRQLLDAGEEVAFLGLLDPSSPGRDRVAAPERPWPGWLKRGVAFSSFVFGRLQLYRMQMRGCGLRQQTRLVYDKLRLFGEIVRKRDVFRGDHREFNAFRVHEANRRALLRYKPEPLRGATANVEIFATARNAIETPSDSCARWSTLAATQVPYHRVPGENTVDMLRGEWARALAALVTARLQHARSARR